MTGPTITSEGSRALINHQPNNLVRSTTYILYIVHVSVSFINYTGRTYCS